MRPAPTRSLDCGEGEVIRIPRDVSRYLRVQHPRLPRRQLLQPHACGPRLILSVGDAVVLEQLSATSPQQQQHAKKEKKRQHQDKAEASLILQQHCL
jgi:hypothetical protein